MLVCVMDQADKLFVNKRLLTDHLHGKTAELCLAKR